VSRNIVCAYFNKPENFLSIVNVSNEKATAKSNSSCRDGKHVLEEKGSCFRCFFATIFPKGIAR
jgi:hypothetical protein